VDEEDVRPLAQLVEVSGTKHPSVRHGLDVCKSIAMELRGRDRATGLTLQIIVNGRPSAQQAILIGLRFLSVAN